MQQNLKVMIVLGVTMLVLCSCGWLLWSYMAEIICLDTNKKACVIKNLILDILLFLEGPGCSSLVPRVQFPGSLVPWVWFPGSRGAVPQVRLPVSLGPLPRYPTYDSPVPLVWFTRCGSPAAVPQPRFPGCSSPGAVPWVRFPRFPGCGSPVPQCSSTVLWV